MRKPRGDFYHLHIELERELADELKEILPGKGLLSTLIRQFLQNYINTYKELGKAALEGGAVSSATKRTLVEDIRRR